MKFTKAEFIYYLRKQLDEPTDDFYADDELTSYLNEGICDIAKELNLESYNSLSLVDAAVVEFKDIFKDENDAVNIVKIHMLLLDGKVLEKGLLQDQIKGKDVYVFWDQKIRFQSAKSGLLEAFYIRAPKTLSLDADVTDIPEIYQSLIIDYAMAKCKLKDEALQNRDAVMNDYFRKKNEMMQETTNMEDENGVYFVKWSDEV